MISLHSDDSNKSFPSIGSYLSILHRYGSCHLTHEFAKYNIGYGQIHFLMTLYQKDGLKHDALTKIVRVDKATTTRAISKLYDNGYVTVIQDDVDKRSYRVFLTEKALSIRAEALEIIDSWQQTLLRALSEDEIQQLSNIFYKIATSNELL